MTGQEDARAWSGRARVAAGRRVGAEAVSSAPHPPSALAVCVSVITRVLLCDSRVWLALVVVLYDGTA